MNIEWRFPSTGGGAIYGLNDGSQEHFKTDEWEHTIREIVQNSLDAVKDDNKPVTIKITRMDVPRNEIGADDLARHMAEVSKYVKKDNAGAAEYFDRAAEILKKDNISTLVITDANTTGLDGDNWEALTHCEGIPRKRGMGAPGGSFGIGKNAPYLMSDVKTICYSTRYVNRSRHEKFIARCKIPSHPDPDNRDDIVQNSGFGARPLPPNKKILPIEGNNIYRGFRLPENGTGIFIIGFNPKHRWIDNAKKTIARYFFAAIHYKKLRVRIEDEDIAHDTLDDIFRKANDQKIYYHYYQLLQKADTRTETIEGEFGRFVLRLHVGNDDYGNRIAYINQRGMLVTDSRQFGSNPFHSQAISRWAKYVAVLVAADDQTDKKIREMEPPNHSSIEYKRVSEDRRDATERQLRDISKMIGDIINREAMQGTSQETNLSELANIIPAEEDPQTEGSGAGSKNVNLDVRVKAPAHGRGTLAKPGGTGAGGEGTSRSGGKGKGRNTPGGMAGAANRNPIFDKARVMRHGDTLRVAFTPNRDAEAIRFAVRPAGEESVFERAIRLSGAENASADGAQVNVKDCVVTVLPRGRRRLVLDLKVGNKLAYTGYELVEYEGGKER